MTIQTSWEMMQQYRAALDTAKWRKQVRAEHWEQIRLAGDYMRLLRYWLTIASSHHTLEARKAALVEHLARINALQTRQAVTFCCEIKLVGDSCQNNLMAAVNWADTALTAPTFESWDNCTRIVNACVADALVQLAVVRSTFKSGWKQAKADMNTARIVIDTCAKDILHPVALPKAKRKEMIRKLMNTVINDSRAPIRTNSSLYFFANLVHAKARKKYYGFTITYSIWNRALDIRAMYPR